MSSQMPSPWITQNTPAPMADHDRALDLACGKGRHSLYLADQGWQVTAVDRDLSETDQNMHTSIRWIEADLEQGHWPFEDTQFDLVVVTNYLHRPLFQHLRDATRPGGIVIYETFMVGNEEFGRPRSPDFLLRPDELTHAFSGWTIMDQMQGPIYNPQTGTCTAIKQAIVAKRPE